MKNKKSAPDELGDEDEMALFRDAMDGVAPLSASNHVVHKHPPPPAFPLHSKQSGQRAVEDTLSDHITLEIEPGDEWSYLRPELTRQTLKRLRRGYWKIQASLDLHGYTRDEARQELVFFLDECVQQGYRCVLVVHGKGMSSKNREPVLKTRIGNWLAQRQDVLAFCQARPEDGGGGAVVVLLRRC